MSEFPALCPETFVEEMRGELETMLASVVEAVHAEAAGCVISRSEEQARELFARMRHLASERAVQMPTVLNRTIHRAHPTIQGVAARVPEDVGTPVHTPRPASTAW